ncbi:hypothetical protein ACOAAE_000650 [Citrobacter freundii]
MTTNNHPAHGPVSLDRLHQIREILSKAAAQSDGGNLGYAMADAVKVIDSAIASFDAEPVAYMYKDKLHTDARFSLDTRFGNWSQEDINEYEITEIPLYTAPPAPVSVPAAMEMDDDFDSAFEHGKAVGWNACRAALLQAGNSPVIADGWVILPAEPTQAMMNAWLSEVANWRGHAAGYRAMIAAAPQKEVK